jgi:tRNA-dihydrouridine synthase
MSDKIKMEIKMNLFLAPIQGTTMACYRNAFSRIFGGIDAYYSPFIATANMTKVGRLLLKDILPEYNDAGGKVIPQILSNNGNDFRFFSSTIVDLGYNEINWNIGCPYPMVARKKKGSGILPYTDIIKSFLDIACADNSYTLTVKMRLGLKNTEEGIRVIEVLNEYPLGNVIIHARTGVQMYTGNVDLDSFGVFASACKHEVTYNGDIFTYDDYINISSRFPTIKNFMLGRGALMDPFLPSAIKGQIIPSSKKIGIIRQFHDEIYNYYKSILSGEKHLCDRMKEFWTYMSVHTINDRKLIKEINKCQTCSAYWEAVDRIFNSSSAWIESPLV